MFRLFLGITLILSSVAGAAVAIDPEVTKALRRNAASVSVILSLEGEADLNRMRDFQGTPEEKIRATARFLENFHSEKASRLKALLATPSLAAEIKEITPLWIVNSLRVRASSRVVEKLLAVNGIESITLDAPKEFDVDEDLPGASLQPAIAPQVGWGIVKMGADQLWAQGITGQGVLVAMIDSGVNLTHPELVPNLWQNPGETGIDGFGHDRATNGLDDDGNGFVDDVVGWNFERKNNLPEDGNGHGTQTAGIVGGAGLGQVKTGVAPGVKMMILRACCEASDTFESNVWEAIQYAVKNGARLISMSVSVKHPSHPQYSKWRRIGEVEYTAGMIHINSAGNRGSAYEPYNIGAPASNPPPYFHPMQVAQSGALTSILTIGATDDKDVLRNYSSTGPVTWEEQADYKDYVYDKGKLPGLIKPDLCGPSEVPSLSMVGPGYTTGFGGTSSATPHVAGVAALLLSALPRLDVAQMAEVLSQSTVKVENDFNNKCGAGRVNAVAALEYARKRFPNAK